MADDARRCLKHPSAQPGGGVCAICLRSRLLRLCPECAGERPRGCSCPSTTSSAAAASSSSYSSQDATRSGAAARGPHLNGGEPALRWSRSAASRVLQQRSDDDSGERPHGGGGWSWLWPFARKEKAWKGGAKEHPSRATRLSRWRSVAVVPDEGAVHGGGGDGRWKGWSHYFGITMMSLRLRRTSKVIQARSPRRAAEEENL